MRKRFLLILSVAVALSLLLQTCKTNEKKEADQKKLFVVTTLFPIYDFAKIIGQQKAEVSLLLPPGVEPHSFEPRPADIKRIQGSDIFIFTGKFMEPWVDNLLKGVDSRSITILDTSKGITLIRGSHGRDEAEHARQDSTVAPDPHIWLDLTNAMKMLDTIAAAYMDRDPENKNFYGKNAQEYKKKLEELDKKYKDTLSQCKNRIIIHAGHFAFGYLARRYDLKYASAYKGFAPDAEPTPRMLVKLVQNVKKHGVRYIYYEELITPKIAEAISKETGCEFLLLHGAHNVTKEEMTGGVNFLNIMEKNLENLKVGLQCP